MAENIFKNQTSAKEAGFIGFKSVKELTADAGVIPQMKGVYMVLRTSPNKPKFLKIGTGGFFKDTDPNVSIEELEANWIEESQVVYIGKAGGSKVAATLQSRLKQYFQFGQGMSVGHYGGRFIWQLADAQDLIVCWKPMPTNEIEPEVYEKSLIQEFKRIYGSRPFANLKG